MSDTTDMVGGLIGAGIGLAIIDRIHSDGRIRYRTRKSRRKKRWS